MSTLLGRLDKAGAWSENAVLVVLLLGMIGLAAWQIIARNLFDSTFITGDELLRILVLWLTLAGALAASRADRHISINLIDRFLVGRWLTASRVVTHAFTAAVCGLFAWSSVGFVRLSHEFGDTLLGDVPAWLIQLVLPVGFGLMAYRHSVHTLREVIALARGGPG